jgi:ribosome-associated protein|tara:strand:+ start:535 stop:1065 length:531 start_codon:yes stop_codon:yes gene_type:complete
MSREKYVDPKISSPPFKETIKSKSALKREMVDLQKIGLDLVELPAKKLLKVELPDDLRESIELAKKIKSREGKRRQIQHIGKIMRSVDVDKILIELKFFDQENLQYNLQKMNIEKKVMRLTSCGDKAIDEILIEFPQIDRKRLRQLTRQMKKETLDAKREIARKKIFTYLMELDSY